MPKSSRSGSTPSKARAFAALIGLFTVLSGCSNAEPEVARHPKDAATFDGEAGSGGRTDASDLDVAQADVVDSGEAEAPLTPVLVGVVPTPFMSDDGGVTAADETRADIDVISAGARATTLVRLWSELFVDGATPDANAWSELRAAMHFYRDAGAELVLCLSIVDGAVTALPTGLTGAWDSAAVTSAVEQLIDQAYADAGAELAYLSFGNEIDRQLAELAPTERQAFTALLSHALVYAKAHALRPSQTKVGVTVRTSAITSGGSTELTELLAASDAVIATYYPIDDQFLARPPSSAAADLDALVSALGGDGAITRVVLQEVGFPSAESVGGSLDKQGQFYDGVFAALDTRRERFPFVVARALYDLPQAVCQTESAAVGASGDARAIDFLCSLGLYDRTDAAKPAWSSVLNGLATFRSP